MKSIIALAAAALVLLPGISSPAAAAGEDALTLADLARGERVKARLRAGGKTVKGTVESALADEIVVRPLEPGKPLMRLSPAQMEDLDVARGKRSRWREGALIGFVPGAVLMGVAVVGLDECYKDCDTFGPVVGYGLAGGAITGAVGALIGLAVKTDRWTGVTTTTTRPRVALTLSPMPDGFRGALSLRF
jgi:hypothetical protein